MYIIERKSNDSNLRRWATEGLDPRSTSNRKRGQSGYEINKLIN